jgi:hypothetical protein
MRVQVVRAVEHCKLFRNEHPNTRYLCFKPYQLWRYKTGRRKLFFHAEMKEEIGGSVRLHTFRLDPSRPDARLGLVVIGSDACQRRNARAQ